MKVTAIGRQAFNYLKDKSRGLVIGVTSVGVFIKAATDKILFLTTQPYKGPLTLNLEDDHGIFDQIENGMEVETGPGEISIPILAFRVQTFQAEVWSPPLPQAPLRSPVDQRETLRSFAGEMLPLIKEQNHPAIYTQLRALAQRDTPPALQSESLLATIHTLHQNAMAGDLPSAREAFNHLLGRGEGLTPAGDDLLLGWLLSLNRWKNALAPDLYRQPLNQAIVSAAYKKTTTLSANLLECATKGEGDERLINMLDAVMCVGDQHAEPLRVSNLIKPLLSWGNSSGLYAFLGMVPLIISPLKKILDTNT
jgi:hypothetical protein